MANQNEISDHAVDIGRTVARMLFAKRGNHSEAHLDEAELAALVAIGVDTYRLRQQPAELDVEPECDDSVLCCPDCEKPNQFGELCAECERERNVGQEIRR